MNVVILDGDVSYPPTSGKRLRSLHLMLGLASRHHITYIARGNGDAVANERARDYLAGKGIDARIIDGQPALIFGPYAGFTTKFLKQGSIFDLLSSIKPGNLKPMMSVALDNLDLTRYLIKGAMQSHRERVAALANFYADAKEDEWSLESAGHRVQIIKQCDDKGGKLEFGTETITSRDGTLAALLGASPGASISVQAMIEVMERCFKKQIKSAEWKHKMKEMIPSYGESLDENVELLHSVRHRTRTTLGLDQSNSKRKKVSEI